MIQPLLQSTVSPQALPPDAGHTDTDVLRVIAVLRACARDVASMCTAAWHRCRSMVDLKAGTPMQAMMQMTANADSNSTSEMPLMFQPRMSRFPLGQVCGLCRLRVSPITASRLDAA